MSGLSDLDRKNLEKKGYITGKKIIQIRFDQKIPAEEIKRILIAQARINEMAKAIK